ncbi:MAG: undecaprenyldiphospho-muramoylpentapeptide beta-N-acetylglucosaminyltransferase [Candidatus Latescibacteria bacterium]|jgi:UDP-N-acetylglucosamine--N-acetylmuramyl-(pentapeptide) pyrophosphoryl-undecaprenol N-acetylglucosamine transferase|nr:undecaprenyldiphospho-muramoylpentapeptide beta-N-acetylglucosaminyltransferase [Candidatus Latescibacterota bacterium]
MIAPRYLFAVTLTGGHAVPALAVAETLRRRRPEADICFVGLSHGVEARMVPRSGFRFESVPVMGLRRQLHPDLLRFPWVLARGAYGSLKLVSSFRPDVVFCTGGYVSGPIGASARLRGVPLVLHEQNSFPGLTMRLLSRGASQVYTAFKEAVHRLGGLSREAVGNPTRGGWRRLERAEARSRFGLDPAGVVLLVVGGSQGARGINRAVASSLPGLIAKGIQILWQTGKPGYDAALAVVQDRQDRVVVRDFIDDMEAAYSAADLALTRAGGMTLAEQSLLGVPAVLVPLPTATENHQEHNARSRVRAGAARMIREAELDADRLLDDVGQLTGDPEALAEMGRRTRKLASPDAAERIVDEMDRAGLLG